MIFRFVFFICFLFLTNLLAYDMMQSWIGNTILQSTKKKLARTAILIIEPSTNNSESWKFEKKFWEQYMNSNPKVDCVFIKSTNPNQEKSDFEQIWLARNTIYIGNPYYEKFGTDRILYKTIVGLDFLQSKQNHFLRKNPNIFINLKNLNEYVESYRQFEKSDDEQIVTAYPDIFSLTSLATGIFPFEASLCIHCSDALIPRIRELMLEDSLKTSRVNEYGVLLYPINSLQKALAYCDLYHDALVLQRMHNRLIFNDLFESY